jgi:hypothetical protein
MKKRKEKGFWVKRREAFSEGIEAQTRAAKLRASEHVAHVTVKRTPDGYEVNYSVAKFFLEEMEKARVEL